MCANNLSLSSDFTRTAPRWAATSRPHNRTERKHEGAEQQQKQPAHLPKIHPLQEHPVHDLAQGNDLQDRRRSRQQPERHREAQ